MNLAEHLFLFWWLMTLQTFKKTCRIMCKMEIDEFHWMVPTYCTLPVQGHLFTLHLVFLFFAPLPLPSS